MAKTAIVKIWNTKVGAIAWDDATGIGDFEYEPSFLRNNWDLAPLKMPLAEARCKNSAYGILGTTIPYRCQ